MHRRIAIIANTADYIVTSYGRVVRLETPLCPKA
jgi:hypothetical protein